VPGRRAGTVRQITLTAVIIQAIALALGLVAWVGILGKTGCWFNVTSAAGIAVAVAGLLASTPRGGKSARIFPSSRSSR
jgi:hypothetical protein